MKSLAMDNGLNSIGSTYYPSRRRRNPQEQHLEQPFVAIRLRFLHRVGVLVLAPDVGGRCGDAFAALPLLADTTARLT